MKPRMTLFTLLVFCFLVVNVNGENVNQIFVPKTSLAIIETALATPSAILLSTAAETVAKHLWGKIFTVLAFVLSLVVIYIIARWKKQPVKYRDRAVVALFFMILSIIISIGCILWQEPGLKPHPLADPVDPAPILILNTRSTESVLLLIAIGLGAGAMLWLNSSLKKVARFDLGPALLTIAAAGFIVWAFIFLAF